jgi:ribonuclease BN (tRNA processing enzyme)
MTELLLRVNGIQAAFGIAFGLDSPRANEGRSGDPYRQANVSYSLVQRENGQVVRHTLIDCGMGVVPSLLDFEQSHGVHVVHEVLLTHPHFDHFAQLDWLSMCLLRSGRTDQPPPLPIYLVHYSGYEDREHAGDPVCGPMDAARFRDELRRVSVGRDIRPAKHGMILGDTVPWPE